jgi:hypothetical protein
MQGNRITIQITGREEDHGDVWLKDMLRQLQAWQKVLLESARVLDTPDVYVRVADLSHNSPSTFTLEVVPSGKDIESAARLVDGVHSTLRKLAANESPDLPFDTQALNAFKELASPIKQGYVEQSRVKFEDEWLEVDSTLPTSVDKVLGPDEFEDGSMTGRLEKINLHRNSNVFTLYSTMDHWQLRCVFDRSLRTDAVNAVDRHVTVFGRMKYKSRDAHPYEMRVEEIEVHPADENLPRLADLRGIAPGLTGGKTSVEYVAQIRNEWD